MAIMEEYINEAFGISKDDKRSLADAEFAYDKKYNAFCLTVSSYSIEKLESTLSKKETELENAKKEKKSASSRKSKLEAQIKIDYLQNVIEKCNSLIKKKKAYK